MGMGVQRREDIWYGRSKLRGIMKGKGGMMRRNWKKGLAEEVLNGTRVRKGEIGQRKWE